MLRWCSILAIALLALLFAACGGDGNGDSDDTPGGNGSSAQDSDDRDGGSGRDLSDVDLCDLLTSSEIEAAVGNSVEDGEPDILISCDWDSDPDDTSVSLLLLLLPTPDICENAFKDDATYDEESGFGAPAFSSYNPVQGGTADVIVCAEGGQLQLVVTGGLDDTANEQKLRSAAIDLMKKALGRL